MQAANTGLTEGSTPAATTMTATSSSSAPCASTIFRCWTTASRWSASRQHPAPPREIAQALRPRTAFGDRFLLHRRLGDRRRVQQLRRLAGETARPTPKWRCTPSWGRRPAAPGEPFGHPPRRHAGRDPHPAGKATIARQTSNTASCAPRITRRQLVRDTSMPTPFPLQRRQTPPRMRLRLRRQAGGVRGAARHLREGKEQVFYIGTNDTRC